MRWRFRHRQVPGSPGFRAPITKLTADTLVIGEGAGYPSGTYTRDNAAAGQITGTVRYRERIGLPENASIHLTLREVATDGPSRFVANQTIPTQGKQAPETAYLEARSKPGEPLLVIVNGRIVLAPPRGRGMADTGWPTSRSS